MSKSQYEAQIRQKALEFFQILESKEGIRGTIDESSWRDYHVAVDLGQQGSYNLYYSPKRQAYTLSPRGKAHPLILKHWETLGIAASPTKPPVAKSEMDFLKLAKTPYQAFVDGAYEHGRVGYGAVILQNGEALAEFSGRIYEHVESHQIGGELAATMRVIQWCQENNIAAIDIFYDYVGIEKWATGKFKAEKPVSREYADYMQSITVKIHWHKVKSHTGVHWNEIADQLAKKGTQGQ